MTKNILLAATAVSVMAFAGAASAHTITFRAAGTLPAHIIDTDATVSGPGGSYPLAQEAKTPSNTNVFALADTLSSGFLPSGNVVLTIELIGNAEFATAPTAANVLPGAGCTTFTAAPSTTPTAKTAVFIVSNSAANCASFNMDLPIRVTGAGDVSVRTNLVTDGALTPIDNGFSGTKVIISRPDAFAWTVDASIVAPRTLGTGAYGNTVATLDVTPVYTTFKTAAGFHTAAPESGTVGVLGTAALIVDETAKWGLLRTNAVVAAADVLDVDAVVTGNFSTLNTAFGGVVSAYNTGRTTSTHANIQAGVVEVKGALTLTAANEFTVTKTGTAAIPASAYEIAVAYELESTRYNQETAPNRALEPIERDGTNIIFPWMNSTTIQNANGSTNLIRLGNVSASTTGAVYGQVLNNQPTLQGGSYVALTAPKQLFPSIAANGERVINTALLTTELGDFGRGDVQISIEARPEQITARRYATLANGSVTEFESGTVANDQSVGTGAGIVYVP